MSSDHDRDRLFRRLDRQWASSISGHDGLLLYVATLGRLGTGIALAIVADGIMYTGVAGPAQEFAEVLADAAADAIGPYYDEATRADVLESFVRIQATRETRWNETAAIFDKYQSPPSHIDEVAPEDVERYYLAMRDRPLLDLRHVRVFTPGSDEPFEVSNVRLKVDAVSAWWPLKAQGVNVTYSWQPPATS